jgi:CHAT domain-containing protein/Tfp pilus assembly protein PilF
MRRAAVRGVAAAGIVLLAASARGSEAGVVVVRVAPGQVAERAGLRAGDVLVRWERGDASGVLASPFDVAELELEQGPRGPVRLVGRRAGEDLSASLFPDEWGLEARPALTPDDVAIHAVAMRAKESGDLEAAAAGLAALRARVRDADAVDAVPWVLAEIARVEVVRRRSDEAARALEEASAAARASGRSATEALCLAALAAALLDFDRRAEADAAVTRALEVRRRLGPDSLAAAALAEPAKVAGRIPRDEQQKRLEHAIALQERLAPDSLALARSLATLGELIGLGDERKRMVERALRIAERHPDSLALARILFSWGWTASTPDAIQRYGRALAMQERLAPESASAAIMASFLGRRLADTGETVEAIGRLERGLSIAERAAPDTVDHAHTLNNLGLYWMGRGDLQRAEAYHRRALEIEQRIHPDGFGVPRQLYNLGLLLLDRRELDQAEPLFRRALHLLDRRGGGETLVPRLLSHLGRLLRERGDLEGAESAQREALRRDPSSGGQSHIPQRALAKTLVERGKLDEAETLLRGSLESARTLGLGVIAAELLHALGDLALRRGEHTAAARDHREALELRRRHVPGTTRHAESSHDLGALALRAGRREEALALFQEAVDALEAQGTRLGGSAEAHSRFRAHYGRYYRDLEGLLIDLDRAREAFEVVERARARGLPVLLASRDLSLGAGVSDALDRERRQADREHDRLFRAVQEPGPDDAARARLEGELERARLAREDVRSRLRAIAPRAAALRDPAPLDLAGVRRALPPGAVLLAYSVGSDRGRVYAVGPGPDDFAVLPLPVGDFALRTAVRRFREAVDAHRGALGRPEDEVARQLARLLLAPVAGPLRRATEVLIAPDGPLYLLPWAALPSPHDGRPLVTSKAIHAVSSMTLYDTLSRARTRDDRADAVGFGDPAYAAAAGEGRGPLARARSSGLRLDPLPASRREVAALRSLRSEARLLLGPEASETQAKALDRSTRYVHFACHGYLDERFPLESGLVLSTPPDRQAEGDNGFLQAWEVFETVRLDADLVTLSACRTGLGEEMGGEGLLGLAWAFQYAGARSVLASLWEVNDDATATLMTHFYRHLAAGVPKPEALRRAQAEVRKRRTTSAPYFWAGFTLIGAGQ